MVYRLPRRSALMAFTLFAGVALCLNQAAVATSGSKNRPAEKGTILHAFNGFGQVNTYINENAVRIEYPVAGLNLICKKPTYEIVWFNPQAKTIMRETLAEFRQRTDLPPREVNLSYMPQDQVTFAGVQASRITMGPNASAHRFILPSLSASTRREAKIKSSNFYILKGVTMPPPLMAFVDTFFRFPSFPGVPLALTHNYTDGTLSTDYKVERVEFKADFPKGVFDVPTGFKTVYTQPDVAQGPGYKKQFDDLARDMGLGVPLGK